MNERQLQAIVTELGKERDFYRQKLEEVNGVQGKGGESIAYAASLAVVMAMFNAAKAALNVTIDDNVNEELKGRIPGLEQFLGMPSVKKEKQE